VMLAGVLAFTLNSQIRGNAAVTNFLFLPSRPTGVANLRGTPNIG
jgi:hypothetical protein